MTKINLLPPQIREKRASEKRWIYMVGAFFFLILLLALVFGLTTLQIGREESRLAELRTENQKLNRTIQDYKVYEQRKAKLQKIEQTIATALSGEIAWHKIMNEVSMVIPSDVWLEEFTGGITDGITVKGYAVDYDLDTPDLGHKPVAEWIVRLGEIKTLASIWLNFTQKATFEDSPVVQFELTAQIKGVKPASAPAAPPAE